MTTLTAVFSTLFRLSVYFYLRLIPTHRIARFVLPFFFISYLGAYFFDIKPPPSTVLIVPEKVDAIEVKDEKTGRVVEEVVAVEGVSVPVKAANGHVKPARPLSSGNAFIDTIGSIVFSFPSRSKLLNTIGFVLNVVFLLFALDFTYTPALKTYDPTFTRVGAVDHASAKILVRYPGLEEGQLRIVYQRVHSVASQNDNWKEGPVLDIEEEKDWTASGKITGLWPSAEYAYGLAYLNSTLLPYPETPVSFKTFPDPRSSAGTHFKFLVGSCMTPNFPYNPVFPERIKGMDIISDWIDSFKPKPAKVSSTPATPAAPLEEVESVLSDASSVLASATESPASVTDSFLPNPPRRELTPEFMIMAGDAIYADVPYYDGDMAETYRKKYRRTYASPSYRKVYEQLPIFSIYDDHEIINNFAGEGDELKSPFYNASSAFYTYYGSVNPDPPSSDVNYFDFRYGDNAFFVLDTRRYRSAPNTDPESLALPTMLGEKQLYALHSWLGKVNNTATYKFIVSSVPFTSLWHGFDGQKDSWAAYRIERDSLLDVLQYVPNVVILSGDRHEFAFIEHRGKVPEISVSPISMFALNSMTLHARSAATIEKTYVDTVFDAEGASVEVTAIEQIPEERAVHYIAAGNYKFVSLEVDTRDWRRPTLVLEAIIHGKTAYKFEMVGQPVALSYTSSLAVSFGGALKGVLSKIGLIPSGF